MNGLRRRVTPDAETGTRHRRGNRGHDTPVVSISSVSPAMRCPSWPAASVTARSSASRVDSCLITCRSWSSSWRSDTWHQTWFTRLFRFHRLQQLLPHPAAGGWDDGDDAHAICWPPAVTQLSVTASDHWPVRCWWRPAENVTWELLFHWSEWFRLLAERTRRRDEWLPLAAYIETQGGLIAIDATNRRVTPFRTVLPSPECTLCCYTINDLYTRHVIDVISQSIFLSLFAPESVLSNRAHRSRACMMCCHVIEAWQ